MVLGEIMYIETEEKYIGEDGFINIEEAGTLTVSGLDSYHSTKKIARLSYAKPDTWPEKI